jgi:hypothetical protein
MVGGMAPDLRFGRGAREGNRTLDLRITSPSSGLGDEAGSATSRADPLSDPYVCSGSTADRNASADYLRTVTSRIAGSDLEDQMS